MRQEIALKILLRYRIIKINTGIVWYSEKLSPKVPIPNSLNFVFSIRKNLVLYHLFSLRFRNGGLTRKEISITQLI